jgi:hypothetical protein
MARNRINNFKLPEVDSYKLPINYYFLEKTVLSTPDGESSDEVDNGARSIRLSCSLYYNTSVFLCTSPNREISREITSSELFQSKAPLK